jgi:hypothetical protein
LLLGRKQIPLWPGESNRDSSDVQTVAYLLYRLRFYC